MTTKEFLESYGGKLFSKRIKHLDKMEGFKNMGYIPSDRSGITIGYGIDLGFKRVDDLVEYGIDRKTAEMWDEKGYLGKLYTDFEIEAKKVDSKFKDQTPESIAMSVAIDKEIKNKLAQNIFIKADKDLEKYQGKVSDDVYASLTTLHHFGGGFGEISDNKFEEKNALKRKSHAVKKVFNNIDSWIKDNPDEAVPDRFVYQAYRYSQAGLKELSEDNSNTFNREAAYIFRNSPTISEQEQKAKPSKDDKGDNKKEEYKIPDYSEYIGTPKFGYKTDTIDAKDALKGVEVGDIEDEEYVPAKITSLDSKSVDEIETSTPRSSIIDTRDKSQTAFDPSKAEGEDISYDESFLEKAGGLSSLIGLATGAVGLGAALKDVDIPKDPKLGPAFQQRLEESKRLAQQGLTPSELAKAHNDLDSSYATGIENIVRGSAGNRAQFLAGLGGLDVARQSALTDIAVADAQMQRQNQQKYDSMMMMNEQYEAARESKYQNAKFQQSQSNKQAGAQLAGAGISMVADAIGSRQVDRYNKIKTEKMLMDMGYKTDKFGRSGQDQVGTDVTTGEKVTEFLSKAKNKIAGVKDKALNLLSADDAPVKVELEEQQGILGNNKKKSGLIDPTFNPGNEMFGY